jgi:hypothetical protein
MNAERERSHFSGLIRCLVMWYLQEIKCVVATEEGCILGGRENSTKTKWSVKEKREN